MRGTRQSWWAVALLSGVAGALLVLLLPLIPVKALGLPPYWLHLCLGVGIVVTLFVLTRNPAWWYLRAYSALIGFLVGANSLPEFKLTVGSGGWVGHWIQEGVPWHLNMVLGVLATVLIVVDYLTHRPPTPSRDKLALQKTGTPVRDDLFRRNRSQMLGEVKRQVTSQLAQSLPHAGLIDLRKETRPQQVTPHHEFKGPPQRAQLPSGTEILEVFDHERIAGRLLILGTPGVGKTTLLLHLVRELLTRAESDPDAPIPVYVNLSSWTDETPSLAHALAHWLVAELKERYGLRKDIGQHWFEEHRLVPLMDGLDELPSARQERCVQAINQFQQEYRPPHLVVCCRLAEYQQYTTKLELNEAIQLLPFTAEQMQQYLIGAGHSDLWQLLQAQPELFELAQSPLFLRMITLAFDERAIQELPRASSTDDYRHFLFETYIEHMLKRASRSQEHTKERTLHWLAWLAQRLREQTQKEFLIEQLQASWLQSAAQKLAYRIGVVLIVAFVFVVANVLNDWLMGFVPRGKLGIGAANLVGSWDNTEQGTQITSALGIISGLTAGLIVGLKQTIKPIETLQWSGARARREMVLGLQRWSMTGLKYGAYIGLIAGYIGGPIFYLSLSSARALRNELAIWGAGQIAGVIAGLLAGVAAALIVRPRGRRTGELWDWRTIRSADGVISGLIWGLACSESLGGSSGFHWLMGGLSGASMGIIAGLSHRLSTRPAFRIGDTLIVGLIGWLIYSLLTWLTGRLLLEELQMGLFAWGRLWLETWLGIAAAAGLIAWLVAKLRESPESVELPQGGRLEEWHWGSPRWHQWLRAGVTAALLASLIMGVLMGLGGKLEWGGKHSIQVIGIFSYCIGFGIISVLQGAALLAVMAGVWVLTGALIGALFGAFRGGLTGPDIEGRMMPNQGIRQSARNAGRFALIGGLTLGTISGLLNLFAAVLLTELAPDPWDWLHFWLANILLLGIISGLVPAASCFQHFMLRFILWCNGVMPWHYVRFLDSATERMFLQRIGGRYQFLHELLRDHFAEMTPKAAISDSYSRKNCNRKG